MAAFGRERVERAFTLLGEDLARRGVFVEIAVYGGIAIMLQFDWQRATEDVDAVVREGFDEAVLAPSVAAVAAEMGLHPGWLNDAVGMFTALDEPDELFGRAGTYPPDGEPGLRVLLATPRYLLAMKLQALASHDRGDKDMDDARKLVVAVGPLDEGGLLDLYRSVYGEEPSPAARARFGAVLSG